MGKSYKFELGCVAFAWSQEFIFSYMLVCLYLKTLSSHKN
jgi:hypothetical protein